MEFDPSSSQPLRIEEVQASSLSSERSPLQPLVPQQDSQPCPTCGNPASMNPGETGAPSFIYALGRIEPRFPSLGVEKEFVQVTGRAETARLNDRQAFHQVLTQPENRYLVRQMCWVLTIAGLDTYLLIPRDPRDFDLFTEALRREPGPLDLDCVIGVRGPIAPPEMCNGLMIPMLVFDQIYPFDRYSFVQAIPRTEEIPEEEFRSASGEVFDRIMLMDDNAGATDEHRALNYLAVRYPLIYQRATESYLDNARLSAVEARPSRLSGTRKIMDVIFSFTNRQTDVTDKFIVRVDVTEEFPFLVTKLTEFFDR